MEQLESLYDLALSHDNLSVALKIKTLQAIASLFNFCYNFREEVIGVLKSV